MAYEPTGSGYGSSGIPYSGFAATTTMDIVDTAAAVPVFKTLVGLLRETGLLYELQKGGPFTVFAPTDAAFAGLLEPHSFKKLAPLLRPENRAELRKVLEYHIVKGNFSKGNVAANGTIMAPTLAEGVCLPIMYYQKKFSAGTAPVVNSDIPCSNGVIHVIGTVLTPPSFVEQPAGPVKQQFFSSTILDIYKNSPSPRQALGIDPMPEDYNPGKLAQF